MDKIGKTDLSQPAGWRILVSIILAVVLLWHGIVWTMPSFCKETLAPDSNFIEKYASLDFQMAGIGQSFITWIRASNVKNISQLGMLILRGVNIRKVLSDIDINAIFYQDKIELIGPHFTLVFYDSKKFPDNGFCNIPGTNIVIHLYRHTHLLMPPSNIYYSFDKLRRLFSVRKMDELNSVLNRMNKKDLDRLADMAIAEFVETARTRCKKRQDLLAKIEEIYCNSDETEKRFDKIMEYFEEALLFCFPRLAHGFTKRMLRFIDIQIFYQIYKVRCFHIKCPLSERRDFKKLLNLAKDFEIRGSGVASKISASLFQSIKKHIIILGILLVCYFLAPLLFEFLGMSNQVPYIERLPIEYAIGVSFVLLVIGFHRHTIYRIYKKDLFFADFFMKQYLINIRDRGASFTDRYLSFGAPRWDRDYIRLIYKNWRFFLLLSLAATEDRFPDTAEGNIKSGEGVVNIGFMGSITGDHGAIIKEAEKYDGVNFVVVEGSNWIKFKRVKGRKVPFVKRGYIIRGSKFSFMEFKKMIPLHYIVNSGNELNGQFVNSKVPLAGSAELSKVTRYKDITTSILRRKDINVPKSMAFSVASKKSFKKVDEEFVRKYGLDVHFIRWQFLDEAEIRAVLDRFIKREGIKGEIIIKPTTGSCGRDVVFVKAEDIDKAVDAIYNLMLKGEDVVVEERIYSPVFLENGVAQDWNLRIFVSRDSNDNFVVSDMVVRYDDEGVGAVNISRTAKVSTLEDIYDKLGLGENDISLEELRKRIGKLAAKTALVIEEVSKLEVAGSKLGSIHADFMGIDIIVKREGLVPFVIEVNDIQSGGMWDLDNYLSNRKDHEKDRISRSVRDYVRTMIRRAREFKGIEGNDVDIVLNFKDLLRVVGFLEEKIESLTGIAEDLIELEGTERREQARDTIIELLNRYSAGDKEDKLIQVIAWHALNEMDVNAEFKGKVVYSLNTILENRVNDGEVLKQLKGLVERTKGRVFFYAGDRYKLVPDYEFLSGSLVTKEDLMADGEFTVFMLNGEHMRYLGLNEIAKARKVENRFIVPIQGDRDLWADLLLGIELVRREGQADELPSVFKLLLANAIKDWLISKGEKVTRKRIEEVLCVAIPIHEDLKSDFEESFEKMKNILISA